MNYFTSIVLGLVQGVAEFLPISSSGHLSLMQHFMGLADVEHDFMLFDVLLHLGTLVAVFVVYWKDIVELVRDFILLIKRMFSKGKQEEGEQAPVLAGSRMILLLIIATLPLVLVLPIKGFVEGLYKNTLFIGIALLITGTILHFSDRLHRGRKNARSATMLDALLVGCGQALAVVPGLSRSGSTISMGMMRGFDRKFAVRFSFLLSIPAILGANILSLGEAVKTGLDVKLLPMYLVGMAVAAVSGFFAIKLVNMLAEKGKFGKFSYYCWFMGLVAIIATLEFG